MSPANPIATALPHRAPDAPAVRLLLFAIRQTGAQGLHDAAVANAFVTAFGRRFRRPLVLLRALMSDMSSVSSRPIQIAPWCCQRMTRDEAGIIAALTAAPDRPERALILLADVLGAPQRAVPIATAQLLAQSFAEAGLALE
ncbi:hypothetical protein GO308_08070 [Sphingomonas sp. SFZ2018-12]|uniref:DUF6628 family protein n=1 Tax=Sphingomonas sp. SFZ2018-12 TaxID=2683197 RepID=UPI00082AC8B3|nr:DUF6628 family protein [Sphingomonas sp. SFZ2018-12]MCH4893060.1 hypothetical protein [Sphingomonas sp. SFZ2018-12]